MGIESFGETVHNFSCHGLRESYDNEYDARCKSTELLDDTLFGKINDEIVQLHKQINFTKVKDELKEIQSEETEIKPVFENGIEHINHIRLSALKLLLEYIESIKRCNAMYVKYNDKVENTEQENEDDGVYNYVSSIASIVSNIAWK